MTEGTFVGISTSGWVAIVAVAYAFVTAGLAWVTDRASNRALKAAISGNYEQIQAATISLERQMKAAADGISLQVAAARDAAVIQSRALFISNNRQNLINSVRDEVADFIAEIHIRSNILANEKLLSGDREREQLRISRALWAHVFKMRLLLDPADGDSIELINLMICAVNEGLSNDEQEELFLHTQKILKVEWEQVKSGD